MSSTSTGCDEEETQKQQKGILSEDNYSGVYSFFEKYSITG